MHLNTLITLFGSCLIIFMYAGSNIYSTPYFKTLNYYTGTHDRGHRLDKTATRRHVQSACPGGIRFNSRGGLCSFSPFNRKNLMSYNSGLWLDHIFMYINLLLFITSILPLSSLQEKIPIRLQ